MRVLRLALCAVTVAIAQPAAAADLGFNVHQSTDIGLDITKDSGTKWVRIDVNWFDAEPTQGAYNWTVLDQVVDGAKSRGLSVLAVLAYTPTWASVGDAKGGGTGNDVPKPGTYAPFVTAAVNHFGSRVSHYEIWNEPNLEGFFEGTPDDYIQTILIPGADAVHAACATCKVVGPGLASIAGKYDVWMDAVLAQAKAKLDIISGHVYASFPEDGSAGVTSDSFYNRLESHRILKIGDSIVYEGPLSYKEVMDKHKVTQPFWLTETGREALKGDATQLADQKLLYRRVLEAMLHRPWWTGTIFYEAFDNSGFSWGVDGKPTLELLKNVTAKQPLFGGTGTDCEDWLDNDGDGTIDFPADLDCKSAKTSSEGVYSPDAGTPDASEDAALPSDGGTTTNGGGCNMASGSISYWFLALCFLRRRRAT